CGQFLVLEVDFQSGCPPVVTVVPNSTNQLLLAAFGNGLIVRKFTPGVGMQSVYWLDLATGTTHFLGDPSGEFNSFQVLDAGNGTQNLLYFDQAFNGSLRLYSLNSAQLTLTTLTPTLLGQFDYPAYVTTTVINGKYVFGAMAFGTNNNTTAIYQSDGTVAGTTMIGSPFTSYNFS